MFRKTSEENIVVSAHVARRARQVPAGSEISWIEGSMAEIGRSITHHRPGDPLLDEAILGAEAVLALLIEMKKREW